MRISDWSSDVCSSDLIRFTLDDRKVVIHNVNPLYPPVCSIPPEDRNDGVSCNQYQAANFDYPAYTLGLDFQWTDNIFAYAKTSGAYMAGGFNQIGRAHV